MEIFQALISLCLGITYIILAPYFLYAVIWWFPLFFLGGLFSGSLFKKGNIEFLSPLMILQMSHFSKKTCRILGTVLALLSFIGAYQLWNENQTINFLTIVASFIGVMTVFGVIITYITKDTKEIH